MKKNKWDNKIAVITGASSGIGEAIARRLAEAGIQVILIARREEHLKRIQSEIVNSGGRAEVAVADLSRPPERERIFESYKDADILVNNAGFGWYGFFTEMAWETAQAMLLINDHAAVHLTRLFLPEMVSRKWGHIINMSSIVGSLPSQGVAMYSASKAFLDAFTTAIYRETRGMGVNISLVRPGAVKTDFFRVSEQKENASHYPMGNGSGVSSSYVARKVWKLVQRPRRVLHIPGWVSLAPMLELTTGWLQDWIGPIHLKWDKRA